MAGSPLWTAGPGAGIGQDGMAAVAEIYGEHVEGEWAEPEEFFESGGRIVVLGRELGTVRATGASTSGNAGRNAVPGRRDTDARSDRVGTAVHPLVRAGS